MDTRSALKNLMLAVVATVTLACVAGESETTGTPEGSTNENAVEHLVFEVAPGMGPLFEAADHATWTKALSAHPGFMGKETWVCHETGHYHLVVHWKSLEAWKSFPEHTSKTTDSLFAEKMGGAGNFKMVASNAYTRKRRVP